MTVIVTGAAGFIGSTWYCSEQNGHYRHRCSGHMPNNLTCGDKFRNLVDAEIIHYMDKLEFIDLVRNHKLLFKDIDAVFHQGVFRYHES